MNKKNTPLDDIEKIQQHILEREIEEELQRDRLIALWKKYRLWVTGAAAAVLLGVIGYEGHQAWWSRVQLAESDAFENAVVAAHQGNAEEALSALETLADEGKTGYSALAQLERAGILLRLQQPEQALEILETLADDTDAARQLRTVATLALVGHQLESGNPEELAKKLAPVMADKSSPYLATGAELMIVLLLKQQKNDEAVRLIQETLSLQHLPPAANTRLLQLLSVIES